MKTSYAAGILAVALVLAGALALHHEGNAASEPVAREAPASPHDTSAEDPALPPNHPPIEGMATEPATAQPAALRWTPPATWSETASPSAMRLATYRVPAASGAPDEAELSVSRAGGSTEANVQRWIGQFDDAGKDVRLEKTVRGMKVTIVEVSGTYTSGGMMMGTPAQKRPGWALRGAVVETPAGSYFFKLTGPAATVRAARADFDAMIDGLQPAA